MKLSRYIQPHFIKVYGNEIEIFNKNGLPITKPLKIKTLGERRLLQLAYSQNGVSRDTAGQISGIFMYELDLHTETPEYLFRLKLLNNLNIDQL